MIPTGDDNDTIPSPTGDDEEEQQPTIPLAWFALRAAAMRGERSEWTRANHVCMQHGEIGEAWRVPWQAQIAEVLATHGWRLDNDG